MAKRITSRLDEINAHIRKDPLCREIVRLINREIKSIDRGTPGDIEPYGSPFYLREHEHVTNSTLEETLQKYCAAVNAEREKMGNPKRMTFLRSYHVLEVFNADDVMEEMFFNKMTAKPKGGAFIKGFVDAIRERKASNKEL